MSNPFPSPEYLALCIKHKEMLRKLWKPFHYDAVCILGDLKLIIPFEGEDERVAYVYTCPFDRDPMGVMRGIGLEWHPRKNIIWLPRPDQLWEVLEDRGWEYGLLWDIYGPRAEVARRYKIEVTSRLGKIELFGPDPASALLLALIEVMGREESADAIS